MNKIFRMLLIMILICQWTILPVLASSEEGHDKTGRKIHLHAEKYSDIQSVSAVILLDDGSEFELELKQCGNSTKGGQFKKRLDMDNLEERIVAFIVDGYRQEIGTDAQVSLGKLSKSGHEDEDSTHDHTDGDTTEVVGEQDDSEESHGSGGCGNGGSEGKGCSGGSSHESDVSEEVTTDAAIVITDAALEVTAEEEHDHDDGGGKGALNYWLNSLKTSYDIEATIIPEAAGHVENTGSYAKGANVTLDIELESGYVVSSITVNDMVVETGDEYEVISLDEDMDIVIEATLELADDADPETDDSDDIIEGDATGLENNVETTPDTTDEPYRATRTSSVTRYSLELTSTSGGTYEGYEGMVSYRAGTYVTIIPIAEEGYYFIGYSEDSDGADVIDGVIRMDEDKYLMAVFERLVEMDEANTTIPQAGGNTISMDDIISAMEDKKEEPVLDSPALLEEIEDVALPQTSGIPGIALFGMGSAMVAFGLRIKKRY